MRVIQKFGISSPGSPALLYRRMAQRILIQDANGEPICEITADSWAELLRAIEGAPRSWFVVTDISSPPVSDPAQVIYRLAQDHLRQLNQKGLPDEAFPAIAPILLNEGTLGFYQGSVSHDRSPPSHSVARIYLWRENS